MKSKLHPIFLGIAIVPMPFILTFFDSSKALAHTKCRQGLPFGGWTEGCPHVHRDQIRPGGFTGYKTNKFAKKSETERGGWVVVWGDDISETDVASGLAAAGVSIYSGNGAFLLWVEALIDKTVYKIADNVPGAVRNEAKRIAMDAIYRAIRGESAQELSRRFDTVDFKAGAIRYSGGNYAAGVKVSTTWGMKPYVAFRVRSSSSRRASVSSTERNFYLENKCSKPLKFLLRYKQSDGSWRTGGWWNFDPGEGSFLTSNGTRVRSPNSVFYYYANIPGRSYTWSGSENRQFNGRTYPMKKTTLSPDSDGDWLLSLNCSNLN